jgi:hypothetical protein
MAANDIYRLAVEGIGPTSQQLVNVFHYRQIGAVGDAAGADLIDAWQVSARGAFLAAISASCAITNYSVRNLTQVGLGVDVAESPAQPGIVAGDALPPMNAAVITWLTGLIGRRNRGRTYMWPTGESRQTAGQISGTYDTELTTFAGANILIGGGALGDDYQLVVHSEVGNTNRDVTDFVVRQFLATQRRRREGVGE